MTWSGRGGDGPAILVRRVIGGTVSRPGQATLWNLLSAVVAALFLGIGGPTACASGGARLSAVGGPASIPSSDQVFNAHGAEPVVMPLPKPCWVRASAEVVASADEAPKSAIHRARRKARQAAAAVQGGVSVRSVFLDFETDSSGQVQTLLQSLTTSQIDAIVVKERLIDAPHRRLTGGGGYRQGAVVDACVFRRKTGKGLQVRARLARDRLRFRHGDSTSIEIRASESARLLIVNFADHGHATVLVPNAYAPAAFVPATGKYIFPSRDLIERNIQLQVRVPAGRLSAREGILVIAVDKKYDLDILHHGRSQTFRSLGGGEMSEELSSLFEPLLPLPPEAWNFDHLAYEVTQP